MIIYISTLSEGIFISIFSVFIVFLLLTIIALAITSLKYIHTNSKPVISPQAKKFMKPFELSDIKDEDMMVAGLIASIDYYEQTKTNVRIKYIKEISSPERKSL